MRLRKGASFLLVPAEDELFATLSAPFPTSPVVVDVLELVEVVSVVAVPDVVVIVLEMVLVDVVGSITKRKFYR